jgi:hypothetical protein
MELNATTEATIPAAQIPIRYLDVILIGDDANLLPDLIILVYRKAVFDSAYQFILDFLHRTGKFCTESASVIVAWGVKYVFPILFKENLENSAFPSTSAAFLTFLPLGM